MTLFRLRPAMAGWSVFLLLGSAAGWLPAGVLSERLGDWRAIREIPHGAVIEAGNASVILSVYAPGVVRLRLVRGSPERDFSWAVTASPSGGFTSRREDGERCWLETGALRLEVVKKPLSFRFYDGNGTLLNADDDGLGIRFQGTETSVCQRLFPDERFIGLGEKTGPLDRRGTNWVNWNSDRPAYGLNEDPLYASIPFFIGIHGQSAFGIFLDHPGRTFFDFGSSTDGRFYRYGVPGGELNYYFIHASTVTGIVSAYTGLTGRAPLPPLWSLGYQQCRWSYTPAEEVLDVARNFRRRGIPCDVLYLDIDYMDQYKIFTWHPRRFPDPRQTIRELADLGFHTAVIVDPGIKIEPGYFAYDQLLERKMYLTYPDGTPYIGTVWPGRCLFPDFTREEVRSWWGGLLESLTGKGVEGIWNDMNEPAVWGQNIPPLVEFSGDQGKTTLLESRNVYGLQMARSSYEGARRQLGNRRPLVLTRAAYAGIQRYSAIWTGDNVSSEDHMLLSARMVANLGLAGLSLAGPDTGGFDGMPSPELYARWMAQGVYTPFFRGHSAINTPRKEPWALGEQVEEQSRRMIRRRYELLPYIYSLFDEASRTGVPAARSLALEFPFAAPVYRPEFQNQYLFGPFILVAPVPGSQTLAKVWLPPGVWWQERTGRRLAGNSELLMEAPLPEVPVFIRGGAIIPRQPAIQHTGENPGTVLDIHLYPGNEISRFDYYEDDGVSFDHEGGAFFRRGLVLDPVRREFRLEQAEGSRPSRFQQVRLIWHGFPDAARFRSGEVFLPSPAGPEGTRLATLPWTAAPVTVHWGE